MTTLINETATKAQPARPLAPSDYGLGLRRPRLRTYFYSVIASDTVMFYTDGEENIWLRGALVASLLPQLLPLLNGSLTVDTIIERVGTDQRKSILTTLKALKQRNLLEEADTAPDVNFPAGYLDYYRRQTNFLQHYFSDPYAAQARLHHAKLTVLDNGTSFGDALVRQLAATGPGKLQIVNSADAHWLALNDRTADDVDLPTALSTELSGTAPFSQISAHRWVYDWLPPATALNPPSGSPESYAALAELASADKSALLVVLTEGQSTRICDIVNEAALKMGFSWLNVSLKGAGIYVGPAIIPYGTPCWRCYQSRVWANSAREELADLLEQREGHYHEQAHRLAYGNLPTISQYAAAVGAHEVIKAVTHHPGMLYGQVLYQEPMRNQQQVSEVLRLARCKACGRDRIRVPEKLWYIGRPLPAKEAEQTGKET